MQYIIIINLLFFLNIFQPILSINLLNKIDKFYAIFLQNFETFKEKFDEIFKEEPLMDQQFVNAMFKEEFPDKILKAKNEMEKYLQLKNKFSDILKALNRLKMKDEDDKLKKLKVVEANLNYWLDNFSKEALKTHNDTRDSRLKDFVDLKGRKLLSIEVSKIYHDVQKQLDLVKVLVEMHELVNEFVDEMIAQMRIGRIKRLLDKVYPQINEQKKNLAAPFVDFEYTYSKECFSKIEEFIKTAKEELRRSFNAVQLYSNITFERLPQKLEKYVENLKETIFNENSLLSEKVKLKSPKLDRHNYRIIYRFVRVGEKLDKAVDELPNQIESLFNDDQKKKFASLHTKWNDFLSLNIACDKILDRIKLIINENIHENEQNINLADIQWLMEFIEEKLAKMNVTAHGTIYNMAKARKMDELPKELELKNGEMESKERTILIAQNMVFIAAQLGKVYNFKNAIVAIYGDKQIEKSKNARLNKLVLKDLPPQNIAQFFYQKYGEMKKEEQKSSTGIEQSKIGKTENQNFGSNSLPNVVGNEWKK